MRTGSCRRMSGRGSRRAFSGDRAGACSFSVRLNLVTYEDGVPTGLHPASAGQEHILDQEAGKKRWLQVMTGLSRALALCPASNEATEIRDEVSFFEPCKPR
jgi:hypothetical protein